MGGREVHPGNHVGLVTTAELRRAALDGSGLVEVEAGAELGVLQLESQGVEHIASNYQVLTKGIAGMARCMARKERGNDAGQEGTIDGQVVLHDTAFIGQTNHRHKAGIVMEATCGPSFIFNIRHMNDGIGERRCHIGIEETSNMVEMQVGDANVGDGLR